MPRTYYLLALVKWLAAALILRVLADVLSNYPDYFPPDFDSLFLQGREATFRGIYPIAFYVHIFTAPLVLLNGLILMSERFRRRSWRLHRVLGRLQVVVLLLFVLPSSVVMSLYAFGGWPAGLSFLLLSLVTALCAVMGVVTARRRRFALHQCWMTRCYVLLCSAVVLRLVSGVASVFEVPSAERAYILAAWSSWLVPLAVYEVGQRMKRVLSHLG